MIKRMIKQLGIAKFNEHNSPDWNRLSEHRYITYDIDCFDYASLASDCIETVKYVSMYRNDNGK